MKGKTLALILIALIPAIIYVGHNDKPLMSQEEAIQRSKNKVYEIQYQNEKTERLQEIEAKYEIYRKERLDD